MPIPVGVKHEAQQKKLEQAMVQFEESPFNRYVGPSAPELLIVTSSVCYLYSKEAVQRLGVKDRVGILKLGTTWPLPPKLMETHLSMSDRVLVVEETLPVMENNIKAMAMDLTGQVAADALPHNHFSGVSGMPDFIRGSAQAPGGKSFLLLTSTSGQGKKSRIVPMLTDTAIVVPRADVQYVATEYGLVNLFGKSFQERATAMISIAHPDFRDELFHQAKDLGLIGTERTLKESIYGVYPRELEETILLGNESVTIRPAKPVDERRIQEHFYNLNKDDVFARFFHEKTSFVRDEVSNVSQVDYIKDLTIVAVIGEFGFGNVVGVGEYLLDPSNNMAEIAFSVSQNFKKKGLGKILLQKLGETALLKGISGLFAFTSPDNRGMINLFKTLPYKVTKKFEDDLVLLKCHFNETEE